jgi:hypothetical protein
MPKTTKEQLIKRYHDGLSITKNNDDAIFFAYTVSLQDEVEQLKKTLSQRLKGECSAEGVEDNVFIFEEDRLDTIIDSVFAKYGLVKDKRTANKTNIPSKPDNIKKVLK